VSVARRSLHGFWLGRRGYAPVHQLQAELVAARQRDEAPDVVLLLEHEPVITLGRGAHDDNVLVPRELLALRGVEVAEAGRGGDVTLHAPGQLVCYPIVRLSPDRQDVRRYVNDLAEVMRGIVSDAGVTSGTAEGLIGLWVDEQNPARWEGPERAAQMAKIGAIGVRISRWVTMHGFAFNLTTDLGLFSAIVPCGIREHGVTSVAALTGQRPSVGEVASPVAQILAEVLGREIAGVEDLSVTEIEGVDGTGFG
jgi:lipoyl(octanoyl) transferase